MARSFLRSPTPKCAKRGKLGRAAPRWAAYSSPCTAKLGQVLPFARQGGPFARQVGPFACQVGLEDGFLTSKVGSDSPYSDHQDSQNRAPV